MLSFVAFIFLSFGMNIRSSYTSGEITLREFIAHREIQNSNEEIAISENSYE